MTNLLQYTSVNENLLGLKKLCHHLPVVSFDLLFLLLLYFVFDWLLAQWKRRYFLERHGYPHVYCNCYYYYWIY
jgi:hypothetical protein